MVVEEGSDQKNRHLAPLDDCACVFEEWIYRGQKVPKSHELAHFIIVSLNILGFQLIRFDRDPTDLLLNCRSYDAVHFALWLLVFEQNATFDIPLVHEMVKEKVLCNNCKFMLHTWIFLSTRSLSVTKTDLYFTRKQTSTVYTISLPLSSARTGLHPFLPPANPSAILHPNTWPKKKKKNR